MRFPRSLVLLFGLIAGLAVIAVMAGIVYFVVLSPLQPVLNEAAANETLGILENQGLLASHNSSGETPVSCNNTKNCFLSHAYNYMVAYPENWNAGVLGDSGASEHDYTVEITPLGSPFPECSVGSWQGKGAAEDMTEKDYEDNLAAQIYSMNEPGANFSLISSGIIEVHGMKGTEFVSIQNMTINGGTTPVEMISVMFYKRTNKYVVGCFDDPSGFKTYQPDFESIINSFQAG